MLVCGVQQRACGQSELQVFHLVSLWCPESLGLTIPRPPWEPGAGGGLGEGCAAEGQL